MTENEKPTAPEARTTEDEQDVDGHGYRYIASASPEDDQPGPTGLRVTEDENDVEGHRR